MKRYREMSGCTASVTVRRRALISEALSSAMFGVANSNIELIARMSARSLPLIRHTTFALCLFDGSDLALIGGLNHFQARSHPTALKDVPGS